jgi:two-component system CheB/CheR fusion protein
VSDATRVAEGELGTDEEFEQLLAFIRDARGFDFTGYKRPSLRRRIAHRMQAVGIGSYADYQQHLAEQQGEFIELFNTILINVTAFFRDPPAWQVLADSIVPRLLEDKGEGAPIRIWSAGCATGEEAYTLAMIFAEAMGVDGFKEFVKIYATDVDEDALSDARHAKYAESAFEELSPDYRERYFEESNGRRVFRGDLRRCVIFGRNDLIVDPPISRIDLISARNTLMYFSPETQSKILGNFHFALNPDGFLFLGRSEVLLTRSTYFEPVDLKRRVFRKVPGGEFREGLRQLAHVPAPIAADAVDDGERIRHASFEAAPVAQIVVDRGGRLGAANVQARTLFGVGFSDIGQPLQDLEISYRPVELRSRIDEVHAVHHTIAVRDVEWVVGGETKWFDVQLSPLHATDGESIGVGITFNETTRYRALRDTLEHSKERLETAYEELQSTAEELETTNEELQSTNEELETTNEELQSTNEELETMNEELQSTNEELHTINDELRERTEDLDQVNAFLESILGSLGAGVLVTDDEFRIQAWNEHARELWGLSAEEVRGQHLMNLDIGLPVDRAMPLLRSALAGSDGSEESFEAVNRRGRQIVCRVSAMPLTAPDDSIRGVIVLMRAGGAAEDGGG